MSFRLGAVAGLGCIAAVTAHADAVLSTPTTRVSAGAEVELLLTITNPADAPLTTELYVPTHVLAQ